MGADVTLTGPVTRAEVARWREAILAAGGPIGPLRLDLSESGPWDLAGLQLLVAAARDRRRGGGGLVLSHAPEGLSALAAASGLSEWLATEG